MTRRILLLFLAAFAFICYNPAVEPLSNQIWEYAQSHPDGFTLDISTMTEPMEGIAVSYEATQGSHSRESLPAVVRHALMHDGYVGGWLDTGTGLYYFDSTKVFPEDQLEQAIAFGQENNQLAIYILSTGTSIDLTPAYSPAY